MLQLVYRSGFRESTCHLTVVALWDVNGNRNGLWHCHSAIVQKLVAPLLHNSCTVLFDCIIPVDGPCNVHITCICILLIPIDCQWASGRPRFHIVPDLYQHSMRFSRDSWIAIYDSSWVCVYWRTYGTGENIISAIRVWNVFDISLIMLY